MQNKLFKVLSLSCLVVDVISIVLFVVGVVMMLLHKFVFSKTVLIAFFGIIGLNVLYCMYLIIALIANRKRKDLR